MSSIGVEQVQYSDTTLHALGTIVNETGVVSLLKPLCFDSLSSNKAALVYNMTAMLKPSGIYFPQRTTPEEALAEYPW